MFKIHPEIPESLSAETRAFILLCFEPDPSKRVTASDLLRDSFLKQVNKGKKSRIAFKPSGKEFLAKSKSTSSLSLYKRLESLSTLFYKGHFLCQESSRNSTVESACDL